MADWMVFLVAGVACVSQAIRWVADFVKSETVWGKIFNGAAIFGSGWVSYRLFAMIWQ